MDMPLLAQAQDSLAAWNPYLTFINLSTAQLFEASQRLEALNRSLGAEVPPAPGTTQAADARAWNEAYFLTRKENHLIAPEQLILTNRLRDEIRFLVLDLQGKVGQIRQQVRRIDRQTGVPDSLGLAFEQCQEIFDRYAEVLHHWYSQVPIYQAPGRGLAQADRLKHELIRGWWYGNTPSWNIQLRKMAFPLTRWAEALEDRQWVDQVNAWMDTLVAYAGADLTAKQRVYHSVLLPLMNDFMGGWIAKVNGQLAQEDYLLLNLSPRWVYQRADPLWVRRVDPAISKKRLPLPDAQLPDTVALVAPQKPAADGPRLLLLLDMSASMQDPTVQQGCSTVIRSIWESMPDDGKLSVITYAGSAKVVFNELGKADRYTMERWLALQAPSGNTRIAAGVRLAEKYVLAWEQQGVPARILWLTDGDFVPEKQVSKLLKKIHEKGVEASLWALSSRLSALRKTQFRQWAAKTGVAFGIFLPDTEAMADLCRRLWEQEQGD